MLIHLDTFSETDTYGSDVCTLIRNNGDVMIAMGRKPLVNVEGQQWSDVYLFEWNKEQENLEYKGEFDTGFTYGDWESPTTANAVYIWEDDNNDLILLVGHPFGMHIARWNGGDSWTVLASRTYAMVGNITVRDIGLIEEGSNKYICVATDVQPWAEIFLWNGSTLATQRAIDDWNHLSIVSTTAWRSNSNNDIWVQLRRDLCVYDGSEYVRTNHILYSTDLTYSSAVMDSTSWWHGVGNRYIALAGTATERRVDLFSFDENEVLERAIYNPGNAAYAIHSFELDGERILAVGLQDHTKERLQLLRVFDNGLIYIEGDDVPNPLGNTTNRVYAIGSWEIDFETRGLLVCQRHSMEVFAWKDIPYSLVLVAGQEGSDIKLTHTYENGEEE